jgi:hypothetical protein
MIKQIIWYILFPFRFIYVIYGLLTMFDNIDVDSCSERSERIDEDGE